MDNCKLSVCFDNIVGIKGCHEATTCKYFVNDLPGISTELVDKIADGDHETYLDVFNKAKKGALNSLKNDVLEVLLRDKNRMRFEDVLFNSESARIIRPFETETFDNSYIGVLLTTAKSKYLFAHVKSLSVFPNVTCAVIPKLFDYESNTFIWQGTEEIDLVAGQLNEVIFDQVIDSNKHRALIAVLEVQELSNIPNLNLLSCNRFEESECEEKNICDCLDGSGSSTLSSIPFELIDLDEKNEFAIYPFVSDSLTDLSQAESIKSFICVDLDLVCSIESFLCENAKRLGDALNYKIGVNILSEKLGGYRINNFAKGNLEYTAATKDELNLEYKNILTKIVPTLPLSGSSMCWKCDEKVGIYAESLI